jgi:hypothetical protein
MAVPHVVIQLWYCCSRHASRVDDVHALVFQHGRVTQLPDKNEERSGDRQLLHTAEDRDEEDVEGGAAHRLLRTGIELEPG